ncbi:MAG: DUF885 domain-containing protein [Proteobacteria bacterium]|nr:MAG: DUF885 domain-containing protein [Pseudomonadota bacterium]
MRRGVRIAASAGALVALALAVFAVPTIWGRPWSIEHFYTRVFAELLWRHPQLLTQLRVLEPYGIRAHNRKLDDLSVAAALEEAEAVRENLRTLRSYDRDAQTPAQRLSTDVLGWFLQIHADGEPFLFHDYPLNQLGGVQVELPDFLLNVHPLADARDAEDYVARLAALGAAIDQTIAGVRHRAAQDVVPPRFVVQRVRAQVDAFRAGGADANVLVTGFAERLAKVDSLAPETRARLVAAARAQVESVVLPAWERLAAFLPALEAQASAEVGAWKHPSGSLYYGWALRYHTTTTRSAEEIHALGLREVERIHAEMRAIRQEIEGGGALPQLPELASVSDESSIGDWLRAAQRDPRFLFPDDAEGREQVLAAYQSIIDEAAPRLPALFGRLPQAPVRVERVPPFKEEGAPGAYYMPPPLDGSKPGIFYANLRSVREIPRFGMRTLTYHEAIPGHHLQVAIAQELDGVPIFRRVVPFTAYAEGWALYAERLALEHGFHPTPWDRLGALVAEVFRAARLVVDTGLHAQRWTREQAIDYMLRNTGMPETDVVAEVERYVVMPGQACAYKVGQLTILELRERARARLGERFDLRAFHDVVLGSGALPLELLERVVDEWIERSAAGS